MARPVKVDLLEDRTLLASDWTALANTAPAEIQTMELLTNGDVMAASYTNAWYLLTPSSTGSYVDGTWSQLTDEPTERLTIGSDVMPNGDLIRAWVANMSTGRARQRTATLAKYMTRQPTPGRRSRRFLNRTSAMIRPCYWRTARFSPATWADPKTYLYNIASEHLDRDGHQEQRRRQRRGGMGQAAGR